MTNFASVWNQPNAIERLKELNARGLSCSLIGDALSKEFKTPVSRHAVIGKLWRLKIKVQTRVCASPPAKRKSPDERSLINRRNAGQLAPKPKLPTKAERDKAVKEADAAGRKVPPFTKPQPVDPAIAVAPRPWTTRKSFECAFPLDGPHGEVWSCCNPTDSRYCSGHFPVMFRTTEAGWEREAVRALARAA